eukprot:1148278-Pelagomonas_calceolata.AAC.1
MWLASSSPDAELCMRLCKDLLLALSLATVSSSAGQWANKPYPEQTQPQPPLLTISDTAAEDARTGATRARDGRGATVARLRTGRAARLFCAMQLDFKRAAIFPPTSACLFT